MIKLSKSVEYALFAIKYLNYIPPDKLVSTKELSETMNIPYDLLAKIMQKLVKTEIVSSVQGTKGGYFLSKSPKQINLNEIIKAVDSEIRLTDCMFENATEDDCKRLNDCSLRSPLSNIQNKIIQLFTSTTLEEII